MQCYQSGQTDWKRLDSRRRLSSQIRGQTGDLRSLFSFLKVVNDTAVAVNQGGKEKAVFPLPPKKLQHMDIEEFVEGSESTGDVRKKNQRWYEYCQLGS